MIDRMKDYRQAPAHLVDLEVQIALGCVLCERRLLGRHFHTVTLGPCKVVAVCGNCIPLVGTSEGYARLVAAADFR